jgi:hypothetical protein
MKLCLFMIKKPYSQANKQPGKKKSENNLDIPFEKRGYFFKYSFNERNHLLML